MIFNVLLTSVMITPAKEDTQEILAVVLLTVLLITIVGL